MRITYKKTVEVEETLNVSVIYYYSFGSIYALNLDTHKKIELSGYGSIHAQKVNQDYIDRFVEADLPRIDQIEPDVFWEEYRKRTHELFEYEQEFVEVG